MLTSYEQAAANAMVSRGVPRELAEEAALDGVSVEEARRTSYVHGALICDTV